jgi:HD-like signal output (HDOD) protein
MGDFNSGVPGLEKVVAAAQLPALPQSAICLLELSQSPGNGPVEFAAPIDADPGLTGQVLRFVNSSYFGFAREVSSVRTAISLVGVRTIKNFALWSAVFSLIPNPSCGSLQLKSLWQDSLRRGLFARAMSRLMGLREAEEAFSAALLQDMAVPLLAKEQPQVYQRLLEARRQGEARLSDLERTVFGWTHADAGGLIARQWNLPQQFADLIAAHTVNPIGLRLATEPDKAAVALSSLLPASTDPCWVECPAFESAFRRLAPPDSPTLLEFLGQIDVQLKEFAPVLKLAAPNKTLVEAYEELEVRGLESGASNF